MTPCRLTASLGFVLLLVVARARAEEAPGPEERADLRFGAQVAALPVTLEEAIARVSASGRTVLSARFVATTGDDLAVEVLSDAAEGGAPRLHAGAVSAAGWTPVSRALEGPEEVAHAARLATLVAQGEVPLAAVGEQALRARHPDGRRPTRLLSVEPALLDRRAGYTCAVLVDGLPWTTRHAADGRVAELVRPPYLEAREEAARRWAGRPLPDVDLPHGVWLNGEGVSSLEAWRGSVVLVALTDPG